MALEVFEWRETGKNPTPYDPFLSHSKNFFSFVFYLLIKNSSFFLLVVVIRDIQFGFKTEFGKQINGKRFHEVQPDDKDFLTQQIIACN